MITNLKNFNLIPIAGDASFREFFRIVGKKTKRVLVISRKEKFKNLIVYSAINKYLRKKKIFTPKLFIQNYKKGYIVIEDFGDSNLCKVLKKTKYKFKIYKDIISILLKIQKIKPVKYVNTTLNKKYKLPYYNIHNLHKESNLFIDWYLPLLRNGKKNSKIKLKIKNQLNNLYKKINYKNNFFVHKDFHVSNLMKFKKKIGLIDTQDALIGNPTYDLLSLIDDVRMVTSNKLKKKIYNYYIKKSSKIFSFDKIKFMEDFNILSVQRSLKIIGVFSRLYKRDGKKKYLKLIPYTWKLLENRCKDEIFDDLRLTLAQMVSVKDRKKKSYDN